MKKFLSLVVAGLMVSCLVSTCFAVETNGANVGSVDLAGTYLENTHFVLLRETSVKPGDLEALLTKGEDVPLAKGTYKVTSQDNGYFNVLEEVEGWTVYNAVQMAPALKDSYYSYVYIDPTVDLGYMYKNVKLEFVSEKDLGLGNSPVFYPADNTFTEADLLSMFS